MYVGRIVAVGKTDKPFVAYRVSARAFPNRVARITEVGAAIQPLDPEDMKKNPYIAYNCLRVSKKGVVISNGSHTDPIFDRLEAGDEPDEALEKVLDEMGYERDEYNTPRIAGIVTDNIGYLGIVRADALEVSTFALEDMSCRVICTYEMDRLEERTYPFIAENAEEAAKYVVDGGVFKDLDKPICAASWMGGEVKIFNPHE